MDIASFVSSILYLDEANFDHFCYMCDQIHADHQRVKAWITRPEYIPLVSYLFGYENSIPEKELDSVVSFLKLNLKDHLNSAHLKKHRQELLNYQQHQASAHDLSEHQHDKQSTSSKQHSHQKNTDKDSNLNNDSTFEFCSVFIGDIDSSINEDDLKKAFEFCGKIHSVSIIRDRMGRSKSYGFVNFFTPEAQDRAVDESHKISIKGHKISAQISHGKTTLLLSNIPATSSKENLIQEIERITGFNVSNLRYKDGQNFCHVSFPSKDNADSALTVLNQARLLGNYISAEFASRKASTTSFAKPSSSQQQSRTLYVRNLAFSVDSLALQDHFSKVGKVEKVWIKRDSSGKSMGYAFVDYASEDLAEKALQTLNNTDLKGQLLQVELAKSKPSTAADYASKGIGRNGEILGRGHSKESYKSSRRSDYSHDQQHYHSGSQQSGYGGYDYSSYPPQQYSSHQASAHPEQYGGYSSASHLPGTGSYAPVPAAASYPNYDPNSSTQPPYNSASYYAGYEQQSSRSSSSSIRSQNQNVSGAFGRSRTSRNEEQSRSRFKPY